MAMVISYVLAIISSVSVHVYGTIVRSNKVLPGRVHKDCGGRVSSGIIRYPANGQYESNKDCTWYIQTNGPFYLTFQKFDLEADLDCYYDYVRVGSGSKQCGLMKPPDTYSSNGTLTIVFHSDDAEAGTGFEAHIVPTDRNIKGECWTWQSPACVIRSNIARYFHIFLLEQCKQLCLDNPFCVAVEFYRNHGGKQGKPGECWLQNRADSRGCEARRYNTDLYVRGDCSNVCWTKISPVCELGTQIIRKYNFKSIYECKDLCMREPRCQTLQWFTNHGIQDGNMGRDDCWLLGNSGEDFHRCMYPVLDMDTYVKQSCDQEPVCFDFDYPECKRRAKAGECRRNSHTMNVHCKKSCRNC